MPVFDALGSTSFATFFLTNAPLPPGLQASLLAKYPQVVDNWTLTQEALMDLLSRSKMSAADTADALYRPCSTDFIQWMLDRERRQEPLHALAQYSWANATVAQRHEFARRARHGFADELLFYGEFDQATTDALIGAATGAGLIDHAASRPDARVGDHALEHAIKRIKCSSWSHAVSPPHLELLLYRRPSLLPCAVQSLPVWLLGGVCESLLLGHDDPYDGALLQDALMRRIEREGSGTVLGFEYRAAVALAANPMCTAPIRARLRAWFVAAERDSDAQRIDQLPSPVKSLTDLTPTETERIFEWAGNTATQAADAYSPTKVAAMALLAGFTPAAPALSCPWRTQAHLAVQAHPEAPEWLRRELVSDGQASDGQASDGQAAGRAQYPHEGHQIPGSTHRARRAQMTLNPNLDTHFFPRMAPTGVLLDQDETNWREAPVGRFNNLWYTCTPSLQDPRTAQLWWFTLSLGESLPAFELAIHLADRDPGQTLGSISDAIRAALH